MEGRQQTGAVIRQPWIFNDCKLRMLATLVVLMMTLVPNVLGHGRMMDPPARNSMWRLGFPNPVNYNDNELYCGGRITQWVRNQGKCGVCGDPHHGRRDHEAGGKYANGIITRHYKQGDVIDVTVHITANHRGYFEFRICPVENPKEEVTQECLDKHVLKLGHGEGTRYSLPGEKSNQFFNVSLRLPSDVTCKQCVLQWKYRTGNTWDKDETGKFCVGCGPQEEFYNCADVSIQERGGISAPASSSSLDEAQVEGKNEDKTTNMQKQNNLVFTNARDDVTQKMSEYGKLKAHYVQSNLGSAKYSTFSRSGDSKNKIEPKSLLSLDKAEPVYSQNLLNSDNLKSNLRFGYIKEGESSHRVEHVSSTKPPGVAYMWKAGVSNPSKLDAIRNRFAFSGTRGDNYVSRSQGQGTKLRKQTGFDEVRNTVYVHNEADLSPAKQKLQGHNKFHSGSFSPNSLQSPSQIKTVSESESFETSKPEGVLENHVTRNPSLKADVYLRSLLHDKRITNGQRHGFLNRWKRLRLRHIATLRALNANQKDENSNILPVAVQKLTSSRHVSHQKKISDSGVKKPQLSMSPFTPPPPQSRESEFYQSKTSLTSPSHDLGGSRRDRTTTTRRHYMKKKLPSWLVKALKLRRKQDEETRQTVEESASSSGMTERKNGEKKDWSSLETKADSEVNIKATSFTEIKGRNEQQGHWERTSGSHTQARMIGDDTDVEMEISSRSPELVDNRHDDDSVATSRSDSQSEKAVVKDESKHEKSLLRYIVKWLMSKIGLNSLDDDEDQKSGEESVTHSAGKNDLSLQTRRKNSRERKQLSPISGHKTNPQDSWFASSAHHTTNDRINSDVMKDKTSGKQRRRQKQFLAQGRISQSHSVDPNNNQRRVSPPTQQIQPRAYNNPVLRSDVPSLTGGVKRQEETERHIWESHHAIDNANAMSGYKNSLQNNFGPYRRDSRSHQPFNHKDTLQSSPHFSQPTADNGWMSSSAAVAVPTSYDGNHEWSMRAQNRQHYHQHNQHKTRSQLICHSIATLGQGMNKWCTDNCNANFCPAFLCACEKQLEQPLDPITRSPNPSVYALQLPARHSNTNPWGKSVNGGHDVVDVRKPYTQQGRIAHTVTIPVLQDNQRLVSQTLTRNDAQASKPSYLASNTEPVPSSGSSFGQNIDRSPAQPDKISSANRQGVVRLDTNLARYPNTVVSQREEFPPPGNPIIHQSSNHVFQTSSIFSHPQTGDRWVPRTEGTNSNRFHTRSDRRNQVQDNFVATHDQLHAEPLGHKPRSDRRNSPVVGRGQRRLRCKAIGAYASLQHFDEWCETTCTSSMCPLLICRCQS